MRPVPYIVIACIVVAVVCTGLAGAAHAGQDPEHRLTLPFNGDIDRNIEFLTATNLHPLGKAGHAQVQLHARALAMAINRTPDAATRAAHYRNIMAALQAEDPASGVSAWNSSVDRAAQLALVQRLAIYSIENPGQLSRPGEQASTTDILSHLLEITELPENADHLPMFVGFVDEVAENDVYSLGEELCARFYHVAAMAKRATGEGEEADYWQRKAQYLGYAGESSGEHASASVTGSIVIPFFFAIGAVSFLLLAATGGFSMEPANNLMTRMLPGRLRKHCIPAWIVITQLLFAGYIMLQLAITGGYENLKPGFALTAGTMILTWLYFTVHQDVPAMISCMDNVFGVDDETRGRAKQRLEATRVSLLVGLAWGISVATGVTPNMWVSSVPMQVLTWLFLFYVNFWTGVMAHTILFIATPIWRLHGAGPVFPLGSRHYVLRIGAIILRIGLVMMLYMSLCLGSVKQLGIQEVDTWFSVYMGAAVLGMAAFVFSTPWVIYARLKRKKVSMIRKLQENMSRDLKRFSMTDPEDLGEAGKITETYKALITEISETSSWPFNVKAITSFLSVTAVPILMIAFDLLTNTDSIIYHLEYFRSVRTWLTG